jgi:hypothetical protein
MHESSFHECHIVDSQSPFWPLSQLFLSMLPGHAAPMLQTFGCVQMHENTAASPVGLPPLQPGFVGMTVPFGCVRASAVAGRSAKAQAKSGAASFMARTFSPAVPGVNGVGSRAKGRVTASALAEPSAGRRSTASALADLQGRPPSAVTAPRCRGPRTPCRP